MPGEFELFDLNLPEDSVYHKLLERFPDIQKLRFQDGECLLHEGDMSNEIFMLLLGECAVEQPGERHDARPHRALATVRAEDPSSPSFVGEMAYLGGGFRSATVRSRGVAHVLCLKPNHLSAIIEGYPIFTRILCKQFSARLSSTTEALNEYERLFEMETVEMVKAPGELLYTKGEPADTLYQLLDGTLERETPEGWEPIARNALLFGILDPVPYLCDGNYNATVRAETQVIVAAIPKSSKLALIRKVPQLALNCLKRQ